MKSNTNKRPARHAKAEKRQYEKRRSFRDTCPICGSYASISEIDDYGMCATCLKRGNK